MSDQRRSWLVLLITTVVCLGAAEVFARLLPKNYYEWQHRYMFISDAGPKNTNKSSFGWF